jgi:CheY-like chemotaxis protein
VVDDEALVCDVVEDILSGDHEVVAVHSGRAAKELLERDHRFDVVLCDLMMTDVSGTDLHAWLSENRPRLAARLVFITGGVFTPRTREYLSGVSNQVVAKPFEIGRLRSVVHEHVTAARAST